MSTKKRASKRSKKPQYNVQVPTISYEEYRKITEEFAKEVENLDYQKIASVPAVKIINGVEQPTGITIAELLAMAKMAKLNNRALCIGPSPNGQELTIVSVLKRPIVPRAIKPGMFWGNPVAD